MLYKFITEHVDLIILRTRATVADRPGPRPTEAELSHGVPLFLHEFLERLRHHEDPGAAQIGASASLHGGELLQAGFTIGQVVHGYGDVCQAITGLMVELGTQIRTTDFKTLNLCLDIAIAESVTEYARQREQAIVKEERESLGFLAHELRNLLNSVRLRSRPSARATLASAAAPAASSATASRA
jgi:signal transduction histidine kinase